MARKVNHELCLGSHTCISYSFKLDGQVRCYEQYQQHRNLRLERFGKGRIEQQKTMVR